MTPEQREEFEKNGFLIIRNALSPAETSAANHALDRAHRRWLDDPTRPGTRAGNQSQIVGIIEYDDLFLGLMEHPAVFPHIREILGDDIQMIDNDAHIKPPHTPTHIGWHYDEALPGVLHPGSTMMVKAFFLLSDIEENGGCTAFIPGSNRLPGGHVFPSPDRPEEMPGHVRLTGKAGDAYFFNGHTYHTALPNDSDRARRVLIYNYGHFFMKIWGGYEPSEALKLKATTPLRKQLLGIGDPYSQRL